MIFSVKSIVLIALATGLTVSNVHGKALVLRNSADKPLTSKSIVIQREVLEDIVGTAIEGTYAWLHQKEGEPVFAQFDDLDGDGQWDELFTQLNFESLEIKSFRVEIQNGVPPVKIKTNIRFADINDSTKEFKTAERLTSNVTEISQKYFQFEGPGWENDVVAFRNYFDARNGIDIFGKTTPEMVLDSCGLKSGPTYHEMRSWGMDILKVGNSLGAGALALQLGDQLFRLGESGKGAFRSVVEGPIRSIFDLDFEDVTVGEFRLNVKHRICIEAGKPYYKSEVFIDVAEPINLVAGLVNLQSENYNTGSIRDFSTFYTHDNQAYNGEKLGMAIIVPRSEINVLSAPEEGKGITQTFYAVFSKNTQPIVFYFMAGWEKQNLQYATVEGFRKALFGEVENLSVEVVTGE